MDLIPSLPSKSRIALLRAVLALTLLAVSSDQAYAQASNVVFESAYLRVANVTDCTNANPIVVTIETPSAGNSLSYVPLDAGTLVTITGVSGNTACNVADQAINVLTATTFELTGVAGNGAYVRGGVMQTDTISSATTPSIPMTNNGQGGHLIVVEFPTAGALVNPVQVRIEAANDCPDPPFCATGDWVPISEDIDTAQSVGGVYYNMVRANGAWRAIRINSVLATPTSLPMRVDYTGFGFPIGNINFLGDRFDIRPSNDASALMIEFVAGQCQDSSASNAGNGGNSNPLPTASCEQDADMVTSAWEFPTTGACVDNSFRFSPNTQPPALQFDVSYQSATAGTVEWDLDYCCIGDGEAITAGCFVSAGPNQVVTPNVGTLTQQTIQFSGSDFFIPFVNDCQAGEHMFWRFCRNVGGTSAVPIDVFSITFRGSN